jgi:hypothetical protein
MKAFFTLCFLMTSAAFAQTATISKSVFPLKEVVLSIDQGESLEIPPAQPVIVRLKKTMTVYDCNQRSLKGAFLTTHQDPYLTIASFDLFTTESLCPLKEPKKITIYSETFALTLKPLIAEGNRVIIPADMDLVVFLISLSKPASQATDSF